MKGSLKNIDDDGSPRLKSCDADLKDEVVAVLIDDEPGEFIRFTEDEPAGIGGLLQRLTAGDRRFDTSSQKISIDRLLAVRADHAGGDVGCGAVERRTKEGAVFIGYFNELAVSWSRIGDGELITEYPTAKVSDTLGG